MITGGTFNATTVYSLDDARRGMSLALLYMSSGDMI